MLHRLHDLFTLFATAWRIWRRDGDIADLEIAAYEHAYGAPTATEKNIIVLTPAQRPCDNVVHFRDSRRRMH